MAGLALFMARILVLGASGVFGLQIARELLISGYSLTLAARNRARLEDSARLLSGNFQIQTLDISDSEACKAVARDHAIVVHAAGPYSQQGLEVASSCIEQGCHYVDIADDRAYLQRLRTLEEKFSERGLAAIYGCSSLPGISGALASRLAQGRPEAPRAIEVVLFIGNRNQKGRGALASVFKILGEKISTPQGDLIGMREGGWVDLPAPFGRRLALNFESPEYDLFPLRFQCEKVEVKVAFEWNLANRIFAGMSRAPRWLRCSLKAVFARVANWPSAFGSSGGAIQVRFHYSDGSSTRAEVLAPENGQRMAILPVISTVRKLAAGNPPAGLKTAYELLGAEELLQGLSEQGSRSPFS